MKRKNTFFVVSIIGTLFLTSGLSYAVRQADLDKLLATKRCVWCDLSDADLSGAQLSGATLSNSSLSGAQLSGADLSTQISPEPFYHIRISPMPNSQALIYMVPTYGMRIFAGPS